MSKTKEHYIPPSYSSYRTTSYTNTTKCTKCHLVGMEFDLHPTEACPCCGGVVERIEARKWIEPLSKSCIKYLWNVLPYPSTQVITEGKWVT